MAIRKQVDCMKTLFVNDTTKFLASLITGAILGACVVGWFLLDSFLEVKHYLEAITSISLVFLALYGLDTWYRQSRYERAIKHCSKVFELVSELKLLRHGFMTAQETRSAAQELDISYDDQALKYRSLITNRDVRAQVYYRRYISLNPLIQELNSLRPEMKVAWGMQVDDLVLELLKKTYDIKVSIHLYNNDVANTSAQEYDFVGSEGDDFERALEAIAEEIQRILFKNLR